MSANIISFFRLTHEQAVIGGSVLVQQASALGKEIVGIVGG